MLLSSVVSCMVLGFLSICISWIYLCCFSRMCDVHSMKQRFSKPPSTSPAACPSQPPRREWGAGGGPYWQLRPQGCLSVSTCYMQKATCITESRTGLSVMVCWGGRINVGEKGEIKWWIGVKDQIELTIDHIKSSVPMVSRSWTGTDNWPEHHQIRG